MEVANGSYDPVLVAGSFFIAIAASYTALELVRRVARSSGRAANWWLAAGAVSMGIGIWSMHFVGMLAYRMAMPHGYDVGLTALSLLVGIGASYLTVFISSRDQVGKRQLLVGGVVLGLGIAGMHYTGMEAMQMPAEIRYQTGLFTASIVIAIVAAIAALWIAFELSSGQKEAPLKYKLGAAVIMGFAICGMHYTGMAAAEYVPLPGVSMGDHVLHALDAGDNAWLAVTVSLSTLIILGFTHLTIFFDYKLSAQRDIGAQLSELVAERTAELQQQTEDLRRNQQRLEREAQARKQAQNESARLGRVLDQSSNEIYLFDADNLRFLQVNRGARDNLGYSMEELARLTPLDLKPEYSREQFEARVRPLREDKQDTVIFQTIHQRKDGSQYPIEARLQLSRAEGVPIFAAVIEDIAERKNLEAQLVQAQKLESIGQLAAGIAHEINTPIQFVGDNTRFLQDAFTDFNSLQTVQESLLQALKQDEAYPELVGSVESAVERADLEYLREEIPNAIAQSLDGIGRIKSIVSAMKEFSHPGNKDKEEIDVNRLIENTITVATNEWKYIAKMETEFDEQLPPVACYPQELGQVVLNLIVNAAHAIEAKSENIDADMEVIGIRTLADGDHVEIRIMDSGCGIPEPARDKIFDPFFTTKQVGKGTGQGLSIAHSAIVDKHKGWLGFETETGNGTTFIIRLPIGKGSIAA